MRRGKRVGFVGLNLEKAHKMQARMDGILHCLCRGNLAQNLHLAAAYHLAATL